MQNALILGHTGKLGRALMAALEADFAVSGWNTTNFDAARTDGVEDKLRAAAPDLVLNTVAVMGLDRCWAQPEDAMRINALFPRELARLARRQGFQVAHFSTESVFSDTTGPACTESTIPMPVNVYGLSKFGGESFVRTLNPDAYVFRLPLLFGPDPRRSQFVERMIDRARAGEVIRVSADVITSPTYTTDVARQVGKLLRERLAPGVYHLANAGRASLFELMHEIAGKLGLTACIQRASSRDFPQLDQKNRCTPLASEKLPPMRPWQEAVADYVKHL